MDIKKYDLKNFDLADRSIPKSILEMQKVVSPKCKALSVLGSIEDKDLNAVAVVGSRKLTNYGRLACREVVSVLAAAGVTIVSGLMYGADIEAHKTAIAQGGRTIAVLGYGIKNLNKYRYAKEVADEILSRGCGCVISEYDDLETAKGWTFPQRNRIVAGLSKAVVIIEAGVKSGSLITAGQALDQGKTIFVVPGSIFNPVSKGSHYLIKQGATLLDDPKDVLEHLGLSVRSSLNKRNNKNSLENKLEAGVLKLLKREISPVEVEEICKSLYSNLHDVNLALTSLEMSGHIKKDILGRWEIAV